MNTNNPLPTDSAVDLSRSRILFIDDQDLDVQILHALAMLQQPMRYLCISRSTDLLTQLHQDWDLIIYGQCEALTLSQSLQHIQDVAVFRIPVLIALPQAPQTQDFAHFLSMIRHGVFDLLRIDQVDHIQASLLRALKYSRALQRASQVQRQLEQTQKLNLLLQRQLNHARALIQDGVHIQVNLAYLRLFGLHSASEILGQLLIDVLQPQHRAEFEQQIEQLCLENQAWSHIRIHSLNPELQCIPELDLICIAQPDSNKVEIYILPTALIHMIQQQPPHTDDSAHSAAQTLNNISSEHAANDQYYDYAHPLDRSSHSSAIPQSSLQITTLQHGFDISQLNLSSSAILDLSQQDLFKPQQLQLRFQQLHNPKRANALLVAVSIEDSALQQLALETAAQLPFQPLDPEQQQLEILGLDQQDRLTKSSNFKLDPLLPEQSYIQRLTRSIQLDRKLLDLSCQQLAQLGPEHAHCMLLLQLQHHILLHDPDFAHMLIHHLSALRRDQPVLILEFDAQALLLNSDQALKRIAVLRQCGVLIALRNVQPSAELNALIQATVISFLSLSEQLSSSLLHASQATRQQPILALRELSNFKWIIKQINKQEHFDHAVELGVDFVQGDYIQAEQPQLTLLELTQPH